MANRAIQTEEQQEVDPRSFVAYVLQCLSRLESAKERKPLRGRKRLRERKPLRTPSISIEQIMAFKRQNGIAL